MEPMHRVVVRVKRSDLYNVPKMLEYSSVVECFPDICEALIQSLLLCEHPISGYSLFCPLFIMMYIYLSLYLETKSSNILDLVAFRFCLRCNMLLKTHFV